ncbi:MAG: hypothetical protein F6K42_12150 [Leptolyngbya sp. SIO1D8]|nr:hypothetical protein [Leptolyngbya sp. SIO1D8]
MNDSKVYSSLAQENQSLCRQLAEHSFLVKLRTGNFSRDVANFLVSEQLGYNTYFLMALTLMRRQFLEYPEFLCGFLDPHLSTELGADLESVGLSQNGKTHIAMIYSLAQTLEMPINKYDQWGEAAQIFFDQALIGLIGGKSSSKALGAAYADEVFANVWFPEYETAFLSFSARKKLSIDLEFFNSHANEIEPAHVRHADYLIDFCLTKEFKYVEFLDGYREFYLHLVNKFDGLEAEIDAILSTRTKVEA